MTRSLVEDAFVHHTWATVRLIDACLALDPSQLDTAVPGTYGAILDTMRHLVGSDHDYLWVINDQSTPTIDEDSLDLGELRAAMLDDGEAWARLLANGPDPDSMTIRRNDDGSEYNAPLGIRLAQALCHGTDHRSQICTALSSLGIEPPGIDLWAYAEETGRVIEKPPPD